MRMMPRMLGAAVAVEAHGQLVPFDVFLEQDGLRMGRRRAATTSGISFACVTRHLLRMPLLEPSHAGLTRAET